MDTMWETYLRIINLLFSNMSKKRLEHLKEWEKIYLELSRRNCWWDDDNSYWMEDKNWDWLFVDDDSIFYFPKDLKQLANDGMPKQGDIVQVKFPGSDDWNDAIFVSMFKWKAVVALNAGWFIHTFLFRSKPQKTELTLAEVEKKLGIEKGSLIIKD